MWEIESDWLLLSFSSNLVNVPEYALTDATWTGLLTGIQYMRNLFNQIPHSSAYHNNKII